MPNNSISQRAQPDCLHDLQNGLYVVQEKTCGQCETDSRVYAFLIIGRVLQAAALVSIAGSVAFAIISGPIFLLPAVIAVAMGILGTFIAGSPQSMNDLLQSSRPFVPDQPIGLINRGNNCWLNSSLQLLANSPKLHHRLRQIPLFSQFLDAYGVARDNHQKVAKNIDTHAIRQFLSNETNGSISSEFNQEDAVQLFEYLFEGPNVLYPLSQQINGGELSERNEPLIQIDPTHANFQQIFDNYFDYRSSDLNQHIQVFFPNAPEDLLIQMKRFYQRMDPTTRILHQGKIDDAIDVPESFNLPGHFVRTGASSNYVCKGFSVHLGDSQNSGHYISYVKKGTNWWYCSDSTTYEVPVSQALAAMKKGYIFHFAKTT